ncbi:MAG: aldehyde dehydrogenase family protein [Acidimicrobiales bacterium]
MAVESERLFVGGTWRDAAGTFDDFNPATGEVWRQVADGGADAASDAVEAARAAQPEWAALPHHQRAKVLIQAMSAIGDLQDTLVEALVDEGGAWIGKAMFETGYVAGTAQAAAAAAHMVTGELLPSDLGKVSMVVREPVGVVSVITPWNFPLLLSMRAVAFALAVGNAVVLKPSEETPLSGGVLVAKIFEAAGLPPGVLNVVTCSRDRVAEVGDVLVGHPAVGAVSFTGSTVVGREVAALAGRHLKKVALELGGKDALIVLDDADLERAVGAATFGSFMHAGQICMSTERILVDAAIADDFTERFVAKAAALSVGDPRSNIIGPVINAKQADKIRRHIDDAVARGATVRAGGDNDGLFFQPTVLDAVAPDMTVWTEETFGPVAPVITVSGEEEAIKLANDSDYGLSAGIITADEERGLSVARRLETGMAHVNDTSVYDEPNAPFGGVKNSGLGRHGGKAAIEAFTMTRWLTLERGGRLYPF